MPTRPRRTGLGRTRTVNDPLSHRMALEIILSWPTAVSRNSSGAFTPLPPQAVIRPGIHAGFALLYFQESSASAQSGADQRTRADSASATCRCNGPLRARPPVVNRWHHDPLSKDGPNRPRVMNDPDIAGNENDKVRKHENIKTNKRPILKI